jgi:hypothetical protein
MARPSTGIRFGCMAAEGNDRTPVPFICQECLKAFMVMDVHLVPVIQARPFQVPIIGTEPQGMNQVKPQLGSTAQSSDISGIGGNFGLIQDDMEMGILYDTVGNLIDGTPHGRRLILPAPSLG